MSSDGDSDGRLRIGPYVVDFANMRPRVVIEIDGDSHFVDAGPERDQERDMYLRAEGFLVIRFANGDIGRDGAQFVDAVQARLAERHLLVVRSSP